MTLAPREYPTSVTGRSPWTLFINASARISPAFSDLFLARLNGLSTAAAIDKRCAGHKADHNVANTVLLRISTLT